MRVAHHLRRAELRHVTGVGVLQTSPMRAHQRNTTCTPSDVDFASEFVVTAAPPGPGTVRAWSMCAPCVCSRSPAWRGRTGSTSDGPRLSGPLVLTLAWRMAAFGLSCHHARRSGGPSWHTGAVGQWTSLVLHAVHARPREGARDHPPFPPSNCRNPFAISSRS